MNAAFSRAQARKVVTCLRPGEQWIGQWLTAALDALDSAEAERDEAKREANDEWLAAERLSVKLHSAEAALGEARRENEELRELIRDFTQEWDFDGHAPHTLVGLDVCLECDADWPCPTERLRAALARPVEGNEAT